MSYLMTTAARRRHIALSTRVTTDDRHRLGHYAVRVMSGAAAGNMPAKRWGVERASAVARILSAAAYEFDGADVEVLEVLDERHPERAIVRAVYSGGTLLT